MEKKRRIDLLGCVLCAALALTAVRYVDDVDMGMALFFFAAVGFAVFLLLLLKDFTVWKPPDRDDVRRSGPAAGELVLLNEEGKPISSWELTGKTAAVIGKDLRENHVDVNLSQSVYASLIDVEHAVLNYAGRCWYIEDLDSRNGIVLQKKADGRQYKLSSGQPCKVDRGDIIIVGLTKLELR